MVSRGTGYAACKKTSRERVCAGAKRDRQDVGKTRNLQAASVLWARVWDNLFRMIRTGPRNLITDVAGITVGQAEDASARTGVSVLLTDEPANAAVDIRGGAPGTREIDVLDPCNLVGTVDGIALSGGSVFGLEAASGVVEVLRSRGRGFQLAPGAPRVPIVPGAILFDLANGGDI